MQSFFKLSKFNVLMFFIYFSHNYSAFALPGDEEYFKELMNSGTTNSSQLKSLAEKYKLQRQDQSNREADAAREKQKAKAARDEAEDLKEEKKAPLASSNDDDDHDSSPKNTGPSQGKTSSSSPLSRSNTSSNPGPSSIHLKAEDMPEEMHFPETTPTPKKHR